LREPNQRGTIVNVPGKIVDLLPDPARNRFYVIRQDKNLVLVFDATSFQQIKALRTGNTPTQMAMTLDNRFLIVGNNHSQIASVFNLDSLEQDSPIVFPLGHYPRSVAVSYMRPLVSSRSPAGDTEARCAPGQPEPGWIDFVDFANRSAMTPSSLGIYRNCVPADTILTATESHSKVFAAMADGDVLLYQALVDTFVASRRDFAGLSGSFDAVSEVTLLVDNHLLNSSLVNIGDLETDSGKPSGAAFADGRLIRTTAAGYTNPGMMTKVDLGTMQYILPTRMAEAPPTQADLITPQDGQIGQMISPFTRTLAALSNRQAFVSLSVSGFTVFPWAYDDGVLPSPAIQNVVNAADFTTAVAPGGLISIFGSNLADGTAGAGSFPLPATLAEACLTVNNEQVPLLWASPSQINAQLPFDLVGNGTMVLKTAGGISTPFSFQIASTAPAVFQTGVAGPHTAIPTVVRLVNNELVTFSNPVHPKDNLVVYATGLGAVTGLVNAGDAAPVDPLAMVTTPPTVTLGGMPLPILYAGLVPGFAGLYQINVSIPWNPPEGIQVPLTIEQGGYSTTLPVRVVH
jgi:uncharacterized protein (TIGR03437 family)